MTEPYGKIIEELKPEFSELGFTKLSDSADSAAFGNGKRFLQISTNPHDPLEMTVSIVDDLGTRRALWVIQNILDWEGTQKNVQQARRFILEHDLNNKTIAQMRVDDSVREYVHHGISSILDFLAKYFEQVFNPSEDVRQKYPQVARSSLEKLGIKLN